MTQKEFQDRTGITPTEEEFDYIHAVYMETRLDKDDFCKDFIKHGDSKILRDVHITAVNYEMAIKDFKSKTDCLADFLIGKSRAYNDTDFRTEAMRLVGEKEVVLRTVRMGLPLWDEDKQFIESYLSR